ncbi:hypothetical protein NEOKW01_0898 [Nematocida sp. AWRm80]|nr:hypothetical protein NEOKW01_0898 [Nematocida sp. AWRm80]
MGNGPGKLSNDNDSAYDINSDDDTRSCSGDTRAVFYRHGHLTQKAAYTVGDLIETPYYFKDNEENYIYRTMVGMRMISLYEETGILNLIRAMILNILVYLKNPIILGIIAGILAHSFMISFALLYDNLNGATIANSFINSVYGGL